jgi:excisionase family DNA binding protein
MRWQVVPSWGAARSSARPENPRPGASGVDGMRKAPEFGVQDRRLMTPTQAASYLGLGSRWSIYRLIGAGELPALKLAGKLRLDRVDLDRLIQEKKRLVATISPGPSEMRNRPRTSLAPLLPRRRIGDSSVTGHAQEAAKTAEITGVPDNQSGAQRPK